MIGISANSRPMLAIDGAQALPSSVNRSTSSARTSTLTTTISGANAWKSTVGAVKVVPAAASREASTGLSSRPAG